MIEDNFIQQTWDLDKGEEGFIDDFRKIEYQLNKNGGMLDFSNTPLKLIIIDTIMDLFVTIPQCRGGIFDNKRSQFIETMFQDLRHTAIKHNILFILTNGSSSNFGKNILLEKEMSEYFEWIPKQLSIIPALGKYFPYCCDEIYRFEKKNSDDVVVVQSNDFNKKMTNIMMFIEKSFDQKLTCFNLGIDDEGARLLEIEQ